MLPGDTSYHQLRYHYIKILNKIRKQNQIGAGASEAQPGDAKSGMAWQWTVMEPFQIQILLWSPW